MKPNSKHQGSDVADSRVGGGCCSRGGGGEGPGVKGITA